MANVIWSIGVSLDGYIADAGGKFDWAAPDPELHRFHNEQARELGAHLIGRRLYETMLPWETMDPSTGDIMGEFAGIWQGLPKIVFSRTLDAVEGNARLATGSIEDELAQLGDEDVAVGGAGLAAELTRREPDRRVPPVRQPGRGGRRHALLPAPGPADRPRAGRDAHVRVARRLLRLPARLTQ